MKILRKIHYIRGDDGRYVGGISKIKLIVILTILGILIAGTVHSALYAPALNKKLTIEDSITKAIENAMWVATGTQESVSGNIITAPFDGDPSAPAIYVGDNLETLYKWHEWETNQLKQDVSKWKTKAGEPTAILSHVCRQNGITAKDCPITLYAMAQHESYFGKAMSGDGGRSQGYFHILDIHKLPKTCTHDLECSANFTLKRMIRYGYKTNPSVAIMAHNGTPGTPTTLRYLAAVNSKKALWPKN